MAANGHVMAGVEPNHIENGREFHGWRAGLYMFPCDEPEKERMDIFHTLFLVARHQRLYQAPIMAEKEGTRILDLGTGTGIWAIDMADQYPDAEVVGLDLVNIQPPSIPPNLRFRIPRDYEGIWSLGNNSWDLIHIRLAYGGVSSWPEMYQKVYQHLKPGEGFLEQVEIDYEPRIDGPGSVPKRLVEWYNWLDSATGIGSKTIKYFHETPDLLRQQGFVDVKETVIRLPFNSWPTDTHQRDIGRWYNLGLCEGLEALSLGPFTRCFRWSAQDVRRLVAELKPIICDRQLHLYHNLHIITARKP